MVDSSASKSMFEIVEKTVSSKPDIPLARIRDQPGHPPYSNLVCLGCNRKQSSSSQPFSTCSQCHAVKYCSRDCQLKDWRGLAEGPTKPRKHKDICASLKASIDEFQAHPTAGVALRTHVFPQWANQHSPVSGSFHLHEFLARKKLLGGLEKGFWAIPDVLTPYHTSGKDCHGFQNGQMLWRESFPTMQEGWTSALAEQEQVNVTQPPPNPLPKGGIQGWQDYIQWRSLFPTSVAPLLMTNVLTLYQMIQHELQLYDPTTTSPEGDEEEELLVYVLAVEAELNQIPLLQELLHLMPGIHLQLVYLSPAAKDICDQAAATGTNNLLLDRGFVLDVHDDHTGGRLKVKLDHDFGLYEDVPPDTIQPHAVLGLNAGLASYKTWAPAMHKIIRMGTPFCLSDQTKLIQQFAAENWLPSVVTTINNAFPNYRQLQVPHLTIRLNPFHGIVGRDVGYILAPNICNGYLLTAAMTE